MRRFQTLFVLAALFVSTSLVAAPAAPLACDVLPAATWGAIMGYSTTSTSGELFCTYEGAKKAGAGQLRFLAVTGSVAEAEANVKRMREHQAKGGHHLGLNLIDSQGPIVFSVALFQPAPTENTASQLAKLVAAVKANLAK